MGSIPPLNIRAFNSFTDFDQIVDLFFETIREVNLQHYTQEQVEAWAPYPPDLERWRRSFDAKNVFVAEGMSKHILGFAELEENGHIDRFYIKKDAIGQGVGKALYRALESKAQELDLKRLFVEASITARPFFTALGFKVLREQEVEVRGVRLKNFVMEKSL